MRTVWPCFSSRMWTIILMSFPTSSAAMRRISGWVAAGAICSLFFDAVKKIILAYPVSRNRDTQAAILAIDEVLTKFKEVPEDLTIVVDGNPIYLLAQQFFVAQHGISFDIKQVIGLTNEDPVSAEYRPLKQIIERLNRTFKGNYRQKTTVLDPNKVPSPM